MRLLLLVLLFAAAIPQTLFPFVYVRTRFEETTAGRALMVSGVALAALLDLFLVAMLTPFDVPLFIWCIVVALIACGSTYKLLALLKAQRHGTPTH